jgi:hypothetical protein
LVAKEVAERVSKAVAKEVATKMTTIEIKRIELESEKRIKSQNKADSEI